LLVVGLVTGDYVVGAEFLFGAEPGEVAHFAAAVGAGEQVDRVLGGGFYVSGFDKETIHFVFDDFGDAADVGGDDRDFAGHGFQSGEAEGFELAGEEEKVGAGKFFINVVLLAEEEDVFLEFFLADKIFSGASIGAISNQHQLGGHFGADEGKNFNGIGNPFYGTEIGKVHEDGLAVGSPFSLAVRIRLARVEIAIDEIGDDFDGALDVELFDGLLQEVAGDGGDTVRLLDREFGDGEIGAIAADQGDVGAVEGGDERETARGGHRAREQGADRMRDGVMDVEEIERFGFKYLEHFCGERQGIRGVVEERVGGDVDFVEMDVRVVLVHANGRGVADEMNVVAAGGQFLAEFGGDDS